MQLSPVAPTATLLCSAASAAAQDTDGKKTDGGRTSRDGADDVRCKTASVACIRSGRASIAVRTGLIGSKISRVYIKRTRRCKFTF